MKVINKIAPSKMIRFKIYTREVAELIHDPEKLSLKFEKSKLHIDKKIYEKLGNKYKTLLIKEAKSLEN